MKILFLNIYQGVNNRGAERSTAEIAARLSSNASVLVLTGGRPADARYPFKKLPLLFPGYPDSSGSPLRRFYLDFRSLQILFFTLFSLKYMLFSDFGIIVPVNGGPQALVAKLVCLLRRKKLVIFGRAGIGRDDAFNLKLKPDLFISLTERGKTWAQNMAPGVKVSFLPNGVDFRLFSPAGKKADTGLEPPLIFAAAALVAGKNLIFTIKAVAGMKKRTSLLISGSGNLYSEIAGYGRELLGDRFKLVSVTPEKMPEYYRAASVFTLASVESEAFGNVYLEALSCNIPVVAPSGYRERLVGKAGLFFRHGDVKDYSRKLDLALNRDFGDLPARQAGGYSWDRIVASLKELLLNL